MSDEAGGHFDRLAATINGTSGLVPVPAPSPALRIWVRPRDFDHHLSSDGTLAVIGMAWTRSGQGIDRATLDALTARGAIIPGSDSPFWGRYLVIGAKPGGSIMAVRDPLGACQAYVLRGRGITLVAPTLPVWLARAAQFDIRPDLPAVADLLADPRVAVHRSLLSGVSIIPPGCAFDLLAGRTGASLWSPSLVVKAAPKMSDADARLQLAAAVDRVCGAASGRYDQLIVQLSGGLDSAIVLGSLARLRDPATIGAVNFATTYREGDERALARTAALAAGVALHDEVADPERLDLASLARSAHPLVPRLYGLDPHQERIVGDFARARGAGAILTGQGGDAVFWSLADPLAAVDHARARPGFALFDRFAWTTAQRTYCSIWRIWSMILRDRMGRLPPPDTGSFDRSFIARDVAAAIRSERLVHPWVAESRDLAPGKRLHIEIVANSLLFFLPTLRQHAAALIHPLLCQPVVEACLRIPVQQLAPDRRDRGLARDTFRYRLPQAIYHRTGKGETSRYSNRAMVARLPFLREFLMDGALATAGLLDRAALDTALTEDDLLFGRHGRTPIFYAGVEAWMRQWC